ncbi:MAG: glycogen synthase GlgA [Clostridia bacterium]|nr:glycogen synthase GlgA [Clostridia bacterium]
MPDKKTTTTKRKTSAVKKTVEPAEVKIIPEKSILFVTSEANPFAGTGGLADVAASLPKAVAENGNFDMRVIMPLYSDIDSAYRANFRFEGNFNVPLGWRNQYCGLFSFKYEGVTFYFLDNEYYFKRKGLYGYYDDGERYAFFSRAVLEMMQYLDYYPDVMHCNDWQTALSVIYLKTIYSNRSGYSGIRALFTIHNIEYQGKYGLELLEDLFGLPASAKNIVEYDGCINLMKGAMQLAERFSTVSPRYASEIKNAYFAHGLENMTTQNEYKLSGILNGIDEQAYNPEKDDKLFASYSSKKLSGKAICKAELQKMLALPEKADTPIISVISRLVPAKGLDLIKCVFEDILTEDVQIIILGKGEREYEDYFRFMAERYSGKCRAIIAYNKDLAAKIYSGSDIFLMPSKHEPCGLSQMIACRYGAVPVVRKTGGLADSIVPFNDDNRDGGNGFVFETYNAHEMLYVIKDAIYTYSDKTVWKKLVKRAMTTDFSWKTSAKEYEKLYSGMLI